MLNLIFSNDYEIFFGENKFTEEEILIKTTNELVHVLEAYDIKMSIFADVLCFQRYKQLGINEFPEKVKNQLNDLYSRGHDIQLHIHPHWKTAVINNNSWLFDKSKYKLTDFSKEDISKMVRESVCCLEDLINAPDYSSNLVAFRAGGWSFQPEQKVIGALLENGIRIDSTIFKDGYFDDGILFYDFRKIQANSVNWFFDKEKGLCFDSSDYADSLFEIPIGSLNSNLFSLMLTRLYLLFITKYKYRNSKALMGSYINSARESRIKKLFKYGLNTKPIIFTYDRAASQQLMKLTEHYLKRACQSENDIFVSIIGHSKLINHVSLNEVDRYLQAVKEKYPQEIKFTTYASIYKKLFERKVLN
ncbi:MAG: hypothetical protein ACM3KR_03070 [Deltaproteobacteria bacterium]